MLTLDVALEAHLQSDTPTLTVCWAIMRRDGTTLRGTAHDRDVVITSGAYAGTYRASTAITASDINSASDGSVQNMEVEGAITRVDAEIPDITAEDIEGGLYDQAEAVLLLVNWASPDDGQKILVRGTLGEFYVDSDGRYRTEVRGLTQALSQQIGRTYSERCDVKVFGDQRCGLNVDALKRTGTVTAVVNRKRFTAALDAGPAAVNEVYYYGGRLLWTGGDNAGHVREVRVCQVASLTGATTAEVLLWDETAHDVQVGDTFELPPGCDRTYDMCRLVHNNLVNFRGYGVFAAGRDALMRGVADVDIRSTRSEQEYRRIIGGIANDGDDLL